MTLNEMAYHQGSRDAQEKFAMPAMAKPALPAAGGLNAVPAISATVPNTSAATGKPAASNMGLNTNPVQVSVAGSVPTPTIASMGKPVGAGSGISSPPAATTAAPTTGGAT